jgi:hypothetical protein
MGGFLPIYATGFWPPVMDVLERITVPTVHGYRLTVVLLEEFRRSVRTADTGMNSPLHPPSACTELSCRRIHEVRKL